MDWTPTKVVDGKLDMVEVNIGGTVKTSVRLLDGNLNVHQTLPLFNGGEQFMMISKQELYDIVFNYMSMEEILEVGIKKLSTIS